MRLALMGAAWLMVAAETGPSANARVANRTVVLSARDARMIEAAMPEFRRRNLQLADYEITIEDGARAVVTFRNVRGKRPRLELWVEFEPVNLTLIKSAFDR